MKNLYIIAILVLACIKANAQFSINSNLRPRAEIRHGYKNLPSSNDDAAYFISQRTRLNLNFLDEKYKLGISFQDVRIWGDEELYSATGVKGDNASTDLYQAWLWLKLGNYGFIKAGRQEWVYDDQRLLSNRNWNQHGQSYDGLLIGVQKNKFQFDLGLSLNNDKENTFGNEYTPDKMKFLDFIYVKNTFPGQSYISFIGILSGYQKEEGSETIYVAATFGPYLKISSKKSLLSANVLYQTGTNQRGEKINAYLLSINGSYKFIESLNTGIGIDILSGESNSKGDNSFDILYGGRHRFNGDMDYFSNLVKSTLNMGLQDYYLKFDCKLNAANTINLNYHYFLLHKNIPTPYESTKKSLGSEIDFVYSFNANTPIVIQFGFCIFSPTKTMEYIQGVHKADFSYFSFIQINFTPKLF